MCCSHGLAQFVRSPTRQTNLLDLVLSDCGEALKVQVIPGLSDHFGVLGSVSFGLPEFFSVQRFVWNFSQANWDMIIQILSETNWNEVLEADLDSLHTASSSKIDGMIASFSDYLYATLTDWVPSRRVQMQKCSYPWLDVECKLAIEKNTDLSALRILPRSAMIALKLSGIVFTGMPSRHVRNCRTCEITQKAGGVWQTV